MDQRKEMLKELLKALSENKKKKQFNKEEFERRRKKAKLKKGFDNLMKI